MNTIDLEPFFSMNQSLLCVANTEGRFLKLNQAWTDMLGYAINQLEEELFIDYVHPDDRDSTLEAMKDLIQGRSVIDFANRYRRKDGSYVTIEWRAFARENLIYATAVDVSDRQDQNTLINRLSQAVEHNPAMIIMTDPEGSITYVNPRFLSVTGYERADVTGENPRLFKSGQQDEEFYRTMWQTLIKGENWRGVFQNKKKNGEFYWASAVISPIKDPDETIAGFVAMEEDITRQRELEEELQQKQEQLDLFFRQSLDGFFFMMLDKAVDWKGASDKEALLDYVFEHQHITRINQAMLDQYGAEKKDFIGKTPSDFFAHDLEAGRRIWREFLDQGHLHIDTQEKRFDGAPMTIEGDYICMYDADGKFTGHFGIQRDITKQRELEARLREYSIKDPLTGLINRRHLFERLSSMVDKTLRTGEIFSVALLDIDYFKAVNDTHGHLAGDQVLKELARVLAANVRSYDLVSRYGGEEFLIVFIGSSQDQARGLMERILDLVRRQPVEFGETEISYAFSCGVVDSTICRVDKCSLEQLISRADENLYRAKSQGRNRII